MDNEDYGLKRNNLLEIEKNAQKHWAETNSFQTRSNKNPKKFYVTFPYPYMNGTLHLGHAYTVSKVDFINRFYQLNGYNTLFPFAFHATGTPIVSSAEKVRSVLDGFSETVDELGESTVQNLESNNQIKILFDMGVPLNDMPKFVNPEHWVYYFSKRAEEDLKSFGVSADFSRKFITTKLNPYYDSFVKWQFHILEKKGILKFGKKYLVYSPTGQQPCGDHDRKSGEGVQPQKYHLVTLQLVTFGNAKLVIHFSPENFKKINSLQTISIPQNMRFIRIKKDNHTYLYPEDTLKNLDYQEFGHYQVLGSIIGDELNAVLTQLGSMSIYLLADRKSQDIRFVFDDDQLPPYNGKYLTYYALDKKVESRFGDECVVSLTDQWFIDYKKGNVKDYLENGINTFDPKVKHQFLDAIDWLGDWPVSRSRGLGTTLLDTEYLIDSLSDSTIYMGFYTISHLIKDIPFELIDNELWNYIFLDYPLPDNFKNTDVLDKVNEMKREFEYWYPMDLRVSGKDLIQNHLTMSLYNHQFIWNDPKMYPKSYYTNGHIMLNGKKMSKSEGNFISLRDAVEEYSVDSVRFVLAESSSGLNDANFVKKYVKSSVNKLGNELDYLTQLIVGYGLMVDDELTIWDSVFNTEIENILNSCHKKYIEMDFHNVIINFYSLLSSRDKYRKLYSKGLIKMNKKVISKFLNAFILVLEPICPHMTWEIRNLMLKHNIYAVSVWEHYPNVDKKVIFMEKYLSKVVGYCNKEINNKIKLKKIGKDEPIIISVKIWNQHDSEYLQVVEKMKNLHTDYTKYIDELKSSSDYKRYKIIKLIKMLESGVKHYGEEYLNWYIESDEKLIMNKWLLPLLDEHNIKECRIVECKTDNTFDYLPFQMVISVTKI